MLYFCTQARESTVPPSGPLETATLVPIRSLAAMNRRGPVISSLCILALTLVVMKSVYSLVEHSLERFLQHAG